MSPRPPRSTPLPYTTLFRSGVAVAHGLARAGPLLPAGLEGEDLGLRRDADQAEVGVQRGGDHPRHRGAVDVAVEAGIGAAAELDEVADLDDLAAQLGMLDVDAGVDHRDPRALAGRPAMRLGEAQ